jgi:lysyl-tRNA synthetase class II
MGKNISWARPTEHENYTSQWKHVIDNLVTNALSRTRSRQQIATTKSQFSLVPDFESLTMADSVDTDSNEAFRQRPTRDDPREAVRLIRRREHLCSAATDYFGSSDLALKN